MVVHSTQSQQPTKRRQAKGGKKKDTSENAPIFLRSKFAFASMV